MSSTALKYYQRPGHVIAAGVVLSVIDIISVALRFWTRRKQHQSLKADDWLLIPATLITIGIGICLVYGVSQEALGFPFKIAPEDIENSLNITSVQLSIAFKIEFSVISMLPLALGCIKASFLFFYRRIFSVNKKTDIFLIGMIVLVVLWTLGFFFTVVFECGTNFWVVWSTDSASAKNLTTHCIPTMPLALSIGITDFITDVIIISIPVPLIWRLNFSTSKKVVASAVFLLGAVTIAASLTRLIVITKDVHAAVVFNPYEDAILVITEYLYWGAIECGIGVLAASLPTLRYLLIDMSLKSVIDSTWGSLRTKRSRSHYSSNSDEQAIHVDQIVNVDYAKRKSTSMHSQSTSQTQDRLVPKHHGVNGAEAYSMKDWRISGNV
ncbi:uncharacterized protein GGS25DRAFT_470957 [Hypoxylon fragiforme]|uniref:uncharacterized protein n=1 Tax=Hypoxylon fragiforme TaxID=63214 RepID=UPI0020C5BFE0|nr:uncharacterized protein GGS25DRAFT_470957 [Hypoxylon fragiforme]KAI2614257.1 hypothetical protein GGS25DRAFT_470957 [Hypoxylon fragiforme]